jgi:hypothetical protein
MREWATSPNTDEAEDREANENPLGAERVRSQQGPVDREDDRSGKAWPRH